ncbi:hypothetical protein GCM10025864_00760 [Luteimicrobium album]|uniref:DUF222 domain-containing protein n=1 Tax=Luteimicrobium album TaxID=1054550 RepID=A0ABQ6HV83_9MICO|nr:DUF222 domain-containing protein [Luteimicrobium album]GMA22317.1 hypothetical protein GCM10025864_00760 [Luteimicrobium album]
MFDSGGGGVPSDESLDGAQICARADVAGPSVLELAFAHLVARLLEVPSTGREPAPGDALTVAAGASAETNGDAGTLVGSVPPPEAMIATAAEPLGGTGLATGAPARAEAWAALDLAGAPDDVLVDAIVGWQQVVSWAAAEQARVVGELLARGGSSSRAADAVVHELTAALVTSRRTATALVGRAAGLGRAPEVADALAGGWIDTARADVLVSYDAVPVAVRERVAADLVGTADAPGPAIGLTPAQLRERLRRAAIEADPGAASVRAQAAAADRRHVWIDPAPDQMAWLTALLPAADAARVWARVEDLSRTAVCAPGETRTLAQARADTLTDLVTGTTGTETTTQDGAAQTTMTGSDVPGSDIPATGATGSVGSIGSGAVRTVVNVTVAATTLLGLDESPAVLAGYGPVPAAVARVLAAGGDATWRRILTDPATGVATDVSRTAYRPGVVLGDLVRTRDATCTFPGCPVPATRCDLDHLDPFDPARPTAGQTRADNLHPVCRAHHNAKTHGGWTTSRDPDNTITWTAPSGHRYTTPARPTDPTLPTGPTRHGPPPAPEAPPATQLPPRTPPHQARPTAATPSRPTAPAAPSTARPRSGSRPSRPETTTRDDGDPPF